MKHLTYIRPALIAGVMSVLVIAIVVTHRSASASQSQVQNGPLPSFCSQQAVIHNEAFVSQPQDSSVPAGLPAIAAYVNGVPIPTSYVMMSVHAIMANAAQLSKVDSQAALHSPYVNASQTQVEHMVLDNLIDRRVLVQAAAKQGINITTSQAQASLNAQFKQIASWPDSNQGKIRYEAYLCSNRLTMQGLLSNPQEIQLEKQTLSIESLKKSFFNQHPNETPAVQEAQFAQYLQQVRSSTHIQINLP